MRRLIILPLLLAGLAAAQLKTAPEETTVAPPPPRGAELWWSDDFDDGDLDGWSVEGDLVWSISSQYRRGDSGWGVVYNWGYDQDTRLTSQQLDLPGVSTDSLTLYWWWQGSYYWMVAPEDNGDLYVEVQPVDDTAWYALWDEEDNIPFPFSDWTWYRQSVDLSEYAGQSVYICFHVNGDDDADIGLDEVEIHYEALTAVEDSSWGGIKALE